MARLSIKVKMFLLLLGLSFEATKPSKETPKALKQNAALMGDKKEAPNVQHPNLAREHGPAP